MQGHLLPVPAIERVATAGHSPPGGRVSSLLSAATRVSLAIPSDAPPTCETDGLRVDYRLRAIVDRAWRPDVSAVRRIVVC